MPWLDRIVDLLAGKSDTAHNLHTAAGSGASADDIPPFVPMRPIWAVVSYASYLPGYISLQLVLDLSPAIVGLFFALSAPFPMGPTSRFRRKDLNRSRGSSLRQSTRPTG